MPEAAVNSLLAPVMGAVIDTDKLVRTRFLARHINVTKTSRSLAQLAGAKRAQRRGRGVEFEEVRQYAAGDDIRSIDWRVTARSGEAHTKRFREERERPTLVAIDLRRTMRFGTKNAFKSVLAATVGSAVLWSALEHGERVGGIVVSDTQTLDVRPKRSRHAVMAMLQAMRDADLDNLATAGTQSPNKPIALVDAIAQLRRVARPGSHVFLISDLQDIDANALEHALRPLANTLQLTVLHITDPIERELPPPGFYGVTDGDITATLHTADPALQRQYATSYAEHLSACQQQLMALRIPLITLSTDHAPWSRLQRLFPA